MGDGVDGIFLQIKCDCDTQIHGMYGTNLYRPTKINPKITCKECKKIHVQGVPIHHT